MPLYEYECEACGQRIEMIRKFSDPPLEACTLCGSGPVNRLPSSPAIQFRGSGWYITDYARKGEKGETGETGKSDKTSTGQGLDAKSDAATADKLTKTEGKTDAAAKTDAPAKPSGSSTTTSGGSKD